MTKHKDEKPEIAEALSKLRKQYGEGAVMHGDAAPERIEAIPSGCYAIDRVIGCGGLPRGRIIEIYGEPSSGKTATTLFLISQIQKRGGECVFIDAEHAFNTEFASTIGVDTKRLYMSQPTDLEEAMDTVRAFVNTNSIDLIVVDSVPALVPRKEIEGEEMLKDSMAVQAQLMAKALRIMTGEVARSKTVVIFINHLKEKIGVYWGEKTTTPGGKALKFYASVRLAVSKGEKIEAGGRQIGNKVKIRAVKNKVAPPYAEGFYTLNYALGVDLIADLFDSAVELGVISQSGNTFSFGGEKLNVGRDATIATLKESQTTQNEIEKSVKQKLITGPTVD